MAKGDMKQFLLSTLGAGSLFWFLRETAIGITWWSKVFELVQQYGSFIPSNMVTYAGYLVVGAGAVGAGFLLSSMWK